MRQKLVEGNTHRHLERQHRELRKSLEDGPLAWVLPRFLSASVVGLGLTLVLPGALGGGLGVIDGSPAFWVRLLGPVIAAGVVTPYLYARARRQSRLTSEEVVQAAQAEFTSLTAPGWVGRVVRQGLRMAVAVGVPVGALLALGFPPEELPGGSRLLALAAFTVATAGWTLPAAFVLRWMSLRTHRESRFPEDPR